MSRSGVWFLGSAVVSSRIYLYIIGSSVMFFAQSDFCLPYLDSVNQNPGLGYILFLTLSARIPFIGKHGLGLF